MSKLIFKDTAAKNTFRKELETVQLKAYQLIKAFNQHQSFVKIHSQDEFTALLQNPVEYYDTILIDSIDISSKTGLKPQPSVLAALYNIPRENYIESLGYELINDSSCEGCQKAEVKLIHRKEVLTLENYQKYAAYLKFINGTFIIDEAALEEKLNEFDIYAETPEALQMVEHYEKLCQVLNEAIEFHKLGTVQIQTLAQMFGLLILDNKLIINDIKLSQTIKYLKK